MTAHVRKGFEKLRHNAGYKDSCEHCAAAQVCMWCGVERKVWRKIKCHPITPAGKREADKLRGVLK